MKNTEQLIQQIMNEVKDPALRDSLLKKIVQEDPPPAQSKSVIINELKSLGLEVDQEAAKDLVKFGVKSEIGAGRLVGAVFAVLGVFLCFGALTAEDSGSAIWVLFWGAVFGLTGLYSITGTNKMKRAINME